MGKHCIIGIKIVIEPNLFVNPDIWCAFSVHLNGFFCSLDDLTFDWKELQILKYELAELLLGPSCCKTGRDLEDNETGGPQGIWI